MRFFFNRIYNFIPFSPFEKCKAYIHICIVTLPIVVFLIKPYFMRLFFVTISTLVTFNCDVITSVFNVRKWNKNKILMSFNIFFCFLFPFNFNFIWWSSSFFSSDSSCFYCEFLSKLYYRVLQMHVVNDRFELFKCEMFLCFSSIFSVFEYFFSSFSNSHVTNEFISSCFFTLLPTEVR